MSEKQQEYVNDANEKWVHIEDVAEHLNISLDTARGWLKDGKLPSYKVGKRYKFKLSEIDAWVISGKLTD
jgi:DNA binding domain, excisionase family